ncbi:pre-peptidase C-terminal domain-containing protein [Clostridium estertheticum]|uniref:pre-peptidase C-terminal domain-containing protein n=1 Tax=Clostridium estertheticum TaxID=238834 RepID=UPI00124C3813|nr:pre-peptidase C-terminal domain-containing protein [Clostridium estertheticum]MBZ9618549.1 pre-peptidase C-terminal domain-containing protein [Clostridium estertheticum subsp. laramiense]WAG76473.1 pre-peptidase C-terminal domain-containing protein [Clostridium estertheticum]
MNLKKKLTSFLTIIFLVANSSILAFAGTTGDPDYAETHHSFETAYNVGPWNYKSSIGIMASKSDADYYSFNAYSGDRLAIELKEIPSTCDYNLELYDQYNTKIDTSAIGNNSNRVIRYNMLNSGVYYVKVSFNSGTLPSNITNTYSINFIDRFKTTNSSFDFTPSSISCLGKGAYSSTATLNLKNNSSVPASATVKSAKITGEMSKSLGNTSIELQNSSEGIWYSSKIATSSVNSYFREITVDKQMLLKTNWNTRYTTKAYSSSNISQLKLAVTYEYDSTANL